MIVQITMGQCVNVVVKVLSELSNKPLSYVVRKLHNLLTIFQSEQIEIIIIP